MRRMYSKKQLTELIKKHAVEGLVGKDINVNGITSKGIANTGGLANIGAVAISGELTATTAKIFENIVDAQGHKRFIEGDGTLGAGLNAESVEDLYCRWSLSGTHLMIVFAGKIKDTTAIPAFSDLALFTLPEWVVNKIYPVWGTTNIETKSGKMLDTGWNEQTLNSLLYKRSNGVGIQAQNTVTLTSDKGFRVVYDLLIDNAQESQSASD